MSPIELRFIDLFMMIVAALAFVLLNMTLMNFAALRAITPPPLELLSTSLPTVILGDPYEIYLAGRGGQPPYGWTLLEGRLPDGLKLNANTGYIFGTPKVVEQVVAAIELRDAANAVVRREIAIAVWARANVDRVRITAHVAALDEAVTSATYHSTLRVIGGVPPNRFSVLEGQLPPGLHLTDAGEVVGSPQIDPMDPRLSAPWRFTVSARDAMGETIHQPATISVKYQSKPSLWSDVASAAGACLGAGLKWVILPLLAAASVLIGLLGIAGFRGARTKGWRGMVSQEESDLQ